MIRFRARSRSTCRGDRPQQAVADIAGAFGLSMADVNGVTMISEGIPRSPSSYLLSDIATIPTKYVVAANARNLLPVFLQDYVKVNAEQNAVVLSAPERGAGQVPRRHRAVRHPGLADHGRIAAG